VSAQPDFLLHSGYALRELDDGDARELHTLIERNRARLARWMHWARGQTPQDTVAFIRGAAEKTRKGDGFHRCIVADGRIAGVIGFSSIDQLNHSAPIGYWLDEAHERRGAMTAAVATLTDHAFTRWRLNRVEIRADVENLPSRAIAERLGFQLEGVARQAYLVADAHFSDDAVYAMLASDPARRELTSRARRRGDAVEPTPRR
jgi:ribosomal-protein-serine acetyltransferase